LIDAASGVAMFRRALREGEEARALARLAKEPMQARSLDGFRRGVERAADIKAALRDPRVLAVVVAALGIPDAAQQPGLAMRALLSDPKDPNSLVNRLPDGRWRSAALALDLKARGLAALKDPAIQQRLAEGMQRAARNTELSAAAPGLGDAVLFQDRAVGVKDVYEILGDPVMRRVVTRALGLPQELVVQSIETQARAVTSRLDIAKLSKPGEIQKLAERYLLARSTEGGSDLASAMAARGLTLLA
jgi:hypothetical protein